MCGTITWYYYILYDTHLDRLALAIQLYKSHPHILRSLLGSKHNVSPTCGSIGSYGHKQDCYWILLPAPCIPVTVIFGTNFCFLFCLEMQYFAHYKHHNISALYHVITDETQCSAAVELQTPSHQSLTAPTLQTVQLATVSFRT